MLPRAAKVRLPKSGRDIGADVFVGRQALHVEWIGEGNLGDARRVIAARGRRPDVVVVSRTGRVPQQAPKPIGWTSAVFAVAEALLWGTRPTVSAVVKFELLTDLETVPAGTTVRFDGSRTHKGRSPMRDRSHSITPNLTP